MTPHVETQKTPPPQTAFSSLFRKPDEKEKTQYVSMVSSYAATVAYGSGMFEKLAACVDGKPYPLSLRNFVAAGRRYMVPGAVTWLAGPPIGFFMSRIVQTKGVDKDTADQVSIAALLAVFAGMETKAEICNFLGAHLQEIQDPKKRSQAVYELYKNKIPGFRGACFPPTTSLVMGKMFGGAGLMIFMQLWWKSIFSARLPEDASPVQRAVVEMAGSGFFSGLSGAMTFYLFQLKIISRLNHLFFDQQKTLAATFRSVPPQAVLIRFLGMGGSASLASLGSDFYNHWRAK